jgi:UDP-N-acetylmuramate dehydrogenase
MKIYHNQSLKPYNTFGIAARCRQLIEIENEQEVPLLFEQKIFDSSYLIIGGGSNMLFTQDFDGTVICFRTKGIKKVAETEEHVWIEVAAGEEWADFVSFCIKNQYYGVENLVGIPGLVGSCPVQNIGAYSVEVKDVINQVYGYRIPTGEPFVLHHDDCQFAYRHSIFKSTLKGKCLISRVQFQLSKKEHYTITYQGLIEELKTRNCAITLANVSDAILTVRNRKLPDISKIGSAGSFFQNPVIEESQYEDLKVKFPQLITFPQNEGKVKLAAGQLIELSGMKGVREGDVGVYPNQALVIVNYGNATGKEVQIFYQKVQKNVAEMFGITIVPEVNIY